MTSTIESIKKPKPVTYRYEAYDRQGKLVKGSVKAPNELAAERLIVAKGYNPIQVQVAPSMFSLEEALPTFFTVKPRDVIVFSRQLAILLRSGISLLPAMEILQGQVAASRAFKKILEAIILDIRGGVSFSQALSKHPKAFGEIYYRTISVGEQSGDLHRIRLHAPLMGTAILMSELGRFSRTVSVLISAGMNLQEIMEMAPYSTNNSVFRNALNELRDKLYLGEGLAVPMSRIDLFPPLLIQMVAVGEESNTLDFTLGVVADFCESSADEKAATIVNLIGPLATVSIALLVGFIAISVLMPMYTLTGAFG